MRRHPLATLAILLWLSALPVGAKATAPDGDSSEPHGPSAASWIAGQLLQYQTGLAPFEVEQVARTIEEESVRHGVSRDMILAVMRTESAFFNWARSHAGALGLMQIMPATGEIMARKLGLAWRGPRSLFDPIINIRIGVAYLAQLHRRFGSWERALAAYNWGPGAIHRRIQYGRTLPVRYASTVLAAIHSPTAP